LQRALSGAIGWAVARASCGGESEEAQSHLPDRAAAAACACRPPPGAGERPGRRRPARRRRPAEAREVDFSSDQLTYDSEADVVTATGDVRMNREGNNLRADG
jgi:lipopolysaccharide assembly outer membrane protein LptD (OstA)